VPAGVALLRRTLRSSHLGWPRLRRCLESRRIALVQSPQHISCTFTFGVGGTRIPQNRGQAPSKIVTHLVPFIKSRLAAPTAYFSQAAIIKRGGVPGSDINARSIRKLGLAISRRAARRTPSRAFRSKAMRLKTAFVEVRANENSPVLKRSGRANHHNWGPSKPARNRRISGTLPTSYRRKRAGRD